MTQIDTLIELCRSGEFYKDYDGSTELLRLAKAEADALRKQLEEREKLFLQDAELCRNEITGLKKQLEEARLEVERLREAAEAYLRVSIELDILDEYAELKALTQSGGA